MFTSKLIACNPIKIPLPKLPYIKLVVLDVLFNSTFSDEDAAIFSSSRINSGISTTPMIVAVKMYPIITKRAKAVVAIKLRKQSAANEASG